MGHTGDMMGQKSTEAGHKAMGHSRARTPLRGMSHLSRGTQMHGTRDTEVVGQDKASTPFRTSSHPTATTEPRSEQGPDVDGMCRWRESAEPLTAHKVSPTRGGCE